MTPFLVDTMNDETCYFKLSCITSPIMAGCTMAFVYHISHHGWLYYGFRVSHLPSWQVVLFDGGTAFSQVS